MAISAASYGVGNRVYNGASNAPTRGTVDPMGYIDRGLNNPSQARSGLAGAALARLTAGGPRVSENYGGPAAQPGFNNQGQTDLGPGHMVSATGQLYRPTTQMPQGAPGTAIAAPPHFTSNLSKAKPVSEAPAPVGDTPILKAGPIGWHPTTIDGVSFGHPGATPPPNTSLPYDAIAAAAQQQLNAERDTYHNGVQHQLQQLEEAYTNARRQDELQHPNDLRGLLNSFAARGLTQSSGYGYQLGQENNHYANLLSTLDRSHAGDVTGVNDNLAQYDTGYANQLQQIQAAAAARLAQQAGDLGLNDPKAPVVGPTHGTMNPKGPGKHPVPTAPSKPIATKKTTYKKPGPGRKFTPGGTALNIPLAWVR